MANALPKRARLAHFWLAVKFQGILLGYKLDFRSNLMEQSGQVRRRSTTAKHNDGATPEGLQITMAVTV